MAALRAHPLRKLRGGHDLDGDRHEAMARSAKLRALPEIDAGTVDLHPRLVQLARVRVLLDPEGRYREAVNYVVGGDHEFDDLARGDDDAIVDREQRRPVGVRPGALIGLAGR